MSRQYRVCSTQVFLLLRWYRRRQKAAEINSAKEREKGDDFWFPLIIALIQYSHRIHIPGTVEGSDVTYASYSHIQMPEQSTRTLTAVKWDGMIIILFIFRIKISLQT